MANLFIIGNGFDISHGLNTSYMNFKEWLFNLIRNVDINTFKQKLTNEIRNMVHKQKERMQLFDIAIEGLSIEELERRISYMKQLEYDFQQINEWANFSTNDFDEVVLISTYTQNLINLLGADVHNFSRQYYLDNYIKFRNIFTEFSDKILCDEYYPQTLYKETWELSKLELQISVFLLVTLINDTTEDKWMNFEQSLGELNIDKLKNILYSETETFNDDELLQLNEFILTAFYSSTNLFNVWANEINITSAFQKPDFAKLIKFGDHFFSTNYTRTLEEIYHVQNVCHIHGEIKPITDTIEFNEVLIIGHGYDLMEEKLNNKMPDIKSIANNLLKKPIGRCIVKNSTFFKSLNDVCDVFSYGFSFNDIDMPYISRICESIGNTSKTIWYLNDFNYQEHKIIKNKIKASGFKGQFDTFHVK